MSTGDGATSARSAEAPVSVSMGDSAAAARSAEAPRGNTQSRRRTALVRSESGRRTGWPVGVRSLAFPCLSVLVRVSSNEFRLGKVDLAFLKTSSVTFRALCQSQRIGDDNW